ncbi:hypothetical protein GJ496_002817 [Pomphorhynchus laevis]|nr:hypothetical protein GJ496_002817 [Pomphorhynchus laevis]
MFRVDPNYRTSVVPRWSRSAIGATAGCVIISLGILSLVFEVTNLFRGRATEDGLLPLDPITSVTDIPLTFTENPYWPAAGKGFWVGLFLMATGVVGILSWLDGTRAMLKAFILLSAISTILSFYLMVTSIIPVSTFNGQNFTDSFDDRFNFQSEEFNFNALLIAIGVVGTIVTFLTTIAGLSAAGYCMSGRARVAARPRGVGVYPFAPVRPGVMPIIR